MVFAVADVAISSSCYSASIIVSFYRTVTSGLDIFNHTRTCISCQNTSTTIIIALHLRIVESDVLDAAISSTAKETNFIRGGADEKITDRLPVAVERSLILLRTDRSPTELCYLLFGISLMAHTAHINNFHIIGNLCAGTCLTCIHVVTEPRQMICRLQYERFSLGSITSHACRWLITYQFYIERDLAFDGIAIILSGTDIISGAFLYFVGDFEVPAITTTFFNQVFSSRAAVP